MSTTTCPQCGGVTSFTYPVPPGTIVAATDSQHGTISIPGRGTLSLCMGHHTGKEVASTRNTQFAGFAKALVDDLFKEGSAWLKREQCEKIIAQRAYDLVAHTLNMVPHLMQVAENAQAVEEVIVFIPDLTELPEVSE
jgi:hypothetical protein